MIINYVREHTRFMEYAADEKITASERLLWYALMHIFNARADGSDWPEDFTRISNDRLLMYVPFDYDTLVKARNGLKQKGRIDYRPGDKRRESPSYRMIYFCGSGFIPKKSAILLMPAALETPFWKISIHRLLLSTGEVLLITLKSDRALSASDISCWWSAPGNIARIWVAKVMSSTFFSNGRYVATLLSKSGLSLPLRQGKKKWLRGISS